MVSHGYDIIIHLAQDLQLNSLYDKKATEVHLRSQQPNLWGHFCSQKSSLGHISREQMRKFIYIYIYLQMHNEMPACMFDRCFLSGFSVPLKPSKSRIVEAVCILLCQKYPETQMTSGTGKTSGFNNLLDRSFDVKGWR